MPAGAGLEPAEVLHARRARIAQLRLATKGNPDINARLVFTADELDFFAGWPPAATTLWNARAARIRAPRGLFCPFFLRAA